MLLFFIFIFIFEILFVFISILLISNSNSNSFLYLSLYNTAPSETCKSFVVAQNKFVVTSRRASSGTFSTTVGQNNMCLLCDKVVHNMESKFIKRRIE